ncbi:ATP-binding protein [Streptomyces sp. NPDC054834]
MLIRLPCTARSVSITRRHVHESLLSWQVSPSVMDRLILVVSELVTNAVQHSALPQQAARSGVQSYFELVIYLLMDRIRVEVLDTNRSLPVRLAGHEYAEAGRGMEIIQYCSRDWGAERLCAGGKMVWCDVDMDESPADRGGTVQAPA